jgi:DNA-binding NtrC family response regulator
MDVDDTSSSERMLDRGRVLLVDDERMLRRVLRRGLAQAGFEVVEACDGRAALELLRRERFDLVVSDVQMPVMDGLELLEALPTVQSDVPVVLMSGSLDLRENDDARHLGAFDFLKKPFGLTELQQIALRAANSHRPVKPRSPQELQHVSVR